MANGSNMKRMLTWKTIKKKFRKKSKTSAKKYLQRKQQKILLRETIKSLTNILQNH